MTAGIRLWLARVTAAGTLAVAASAGAATDETCTLKLKGAPAGAPKFADFPVRLDVPARRAAPVLTRENRVFRTQIRRGAAHGPIAAGRYAVADWGCGSQCHQWQPHRHAHGPGVHAKAGRLYDHHRGRQR